MNITVAIPTYNRNQVLVETINQVISQKFDRVSVLIIDQTENHDRQTVEYLNKMEQNGIIQIIKQAVPSLTLARNRALKEANTDIILFLDDDVIIEDNFIVNHLVNHERDSSIAVVTGKTVQRLGWHNPKKKSWPRELDYVYLRLDGDIRLEGIATLMGGNHSINRKIATQMGGYDETFIGSAFREDTDMALRLIKSGFKIVYDPNCALFHLSAPSGGCRQEMGLTGETKFMFSEIYFHFKHWKCSWYHIRTILFSLPRKYIFRKRNIYKPWLVPLCALSFIVSISKTRKALAEKTRGN